MGPGWDQTGDPRSAVELATGSGYMLFLPHKILISVFDSGQLCITLNSITKIFGK